MELIKYPSPNYGLRRDDTEIDFIILHYTAMGTENSLDRLCDPTHEVSCHYLIDQGGLCYQLVDDSKRAWHAGKAYWRGYRDLNSRSLGIELVNLGNEVYPEAQMKKLKSLLKHLIKSYEISPKNVLGHSDIAPSRKSDPGEYFDWKELSNSGLALFPEVSSPMTCDRTFFLAHAERAGRLLVLLCVTGRPAQLLVASRLLSSSSSGEKPLGGNFCLPYRCLCWPVCKALF